MKCQNIQIINGMPRACGGCVACRINYTREWALRCIYELSTSDAASFITLTYSEDNLPGDKGVNIKDLQDFWKRLRINLKREYHEFAPKIRYYACGEYGDQEKVYYSPGAVKPHGRPHYHAIVYGLDDLNDTHRDILIKSWNLCESWFFDKDRGRESGMQQVTPEDIFYVTGYIQKKLNGELGKETYGEASKPFSTCSQGIGLDFALQNKDRLVANGYTYLKGNKISIPRYFCEKFGYKKSDLINSTNIDFDEKNMSLMFKNFQKDMISRGTWYPENEKMMSYRFNLWYERGQWEQAQQIYNDFLQRKKLKGGKL